MKNTKSELKPGQAVYLRTHGGGPFVLIQHVDQMLVDSYRPDPQSKNKNHWKVSRHTVDDTWLVRTKDNNYLHYPTAALTRVKPIERSGPWSTVVGLLLGFSVISLPVTIPALHYLGLF